MIRVLAQTELLHYRRLKLGSLSNSEPNPCLSETPDEVLRECPFPDLLERPEISISAASEGELPLANPMSTLDTSEGNGRTREGSDCR